MHALALTRAPQERSLRREISELKSQLEDTQEALEAQRAAAEQQRVEADELRERSQLEGAYGSQYGDDPYGPLYSGDQPQEEDLLRAAAGSGSQCLETYTADVDLDDDLDGAPPSSPGSLVVARRTPRRTHTPPRASSSAGRRSQPGPQGTAAARPQFPSDWSLAPPPSKRKRGSADEEKKAFPIKTDASGRPLGQLHVGPRGKLNKYN